MKSAQAVPSGYHSVTPYLSVQGADKAIAYYKKAFGAEEVFRLNMASGKVGHAEIKIGDSHIMLADEYPDMGFKSPTTIGGSAVVIHLYVDQCDEIFKRAVDAGAKVRYEMKNQFYGDRSGQLVDPFGHTWIIATHIEDIAPEDMARRAEEHMKNNPKDC